MFNRHFVMFETKYTRSKRIFKKGSKMFGAKKGHTIFCEQDCNFTHHDMLLSLVNCKRNDQKTGEHFKQCVRKELAAGWDRNSDIPDEAKFFRFPLVHWAAVYGKLSALQWLLEQDFDVESTNTKGETALHRLVACQAHERAVDPRLGRGRRYSLGNILQVFTKVLNILTGKCPQILLRYDYVQRNTPLMLCLKHLFENVGTSSNLVQYHQAVFKVLCEHLVNLVKRKKLSEEFVRNGFSLKDSSGNTIWHLAAAFQNESVSSSLNTVMNAVEDLNLSIPNSTYETPILVALKNGNQELAAFIEAYKFSMSSLPIVKMEMLSDSEKNECACEHRSAQNIEQAMLKETYDKCDGSCINSNSFETPVTQNDSLVRDDQSFTERPQGLNVAEQEQVVLTNPEENEVDNERFEARIHSSDTTSTCQVSNDVQSSDETSSQEHLVIEKQIDLCLSVSQSTESSDLTTSDENVNPDLPTESTDTVENTSRTSNILAEALQHADVNENDIFVERCDAETVDTNSQLLTPPDSSTSPDSINQTVDEPRTPQSKENGATRGINVTPVLLIKLLSEPDVSEKFQSLLEDVISGDAAKVDMTETTLQELQASRLNMESEITSSKGVLEEISSKKEILMAEIRRIQQEILDLEASEDVIKNKLLVLQEEQSKVIEKIGECESTCSRLKRRLSDCTGALIGLSPKSRKKC